MNIDAMRMAIMHAPKYDSKGWHDKVTRMSDNQVIAVYRQFQRRDLFKKPKAEKKKKEEPQYHQITLFEYWLDQRMKGIKEK